MSAVLSRGRTGRGIGRAPFFALVLVLLVGGLLTHPRDAHGQTDDSVPTWWHEAAGLTPLLTAPPPPNPATICLIDTGVTPTPDLDITARWAYDGGTLDDVRATGDSPGHGTLVAHFAAGAVNGWGGAGAFPHARISSVRVFPRDGGASWREYIAAISRCSKLDPNTKVIVISIGGQDIAAGEAEELRHHVEQARDLYDVNVVVAAGNHGDRPDFPARFDAAFAVAAHGANSLCSFSARGHSVDVTAPGCGVVQAGPDGSVWAVDGTSFAAPIVAGLLAALRSYAPSLKAPEAEAAVIGSTTGTWATVDARGAFRTVGLGAMVTSAETPVAPDVHQYEPTRVDPGPSSGLRLPKPQITVRRSGRRVFVIARNRPPGALLVVRVANRRFQGRVNRLRVASRARRGRCRFLRDGSSSRWMTVRW